jgi:arylsulfatase A-like enzyme
MSPFAATGAERPVKVFVLAGQSNMVGDGHIEPAEKPGTLAYMVQNSDKAGRFQHLIDANGQWIVRKDVWYFQRQTLKRGGRNIETVDVACGLKPALQSRAGKARIGPELQFGHVMGNHFDQQVLIIKAAWGGKSLAVDFRPPSAGAPSFELKTRKDGTKPEIGEFYRQMISDVRYALGNLDKLFPGYKGQGYEIVGFGWHQGWNDGTNAAYAAEYEENLPLLIRDVRRDLGVKDLPVAIASSGFGGHDDNLPGVRHRIKEVVEPAQIAVAARMDNVTCVETRDFFRPPEQSPTGASYHWNSNAETYFLIGNAMGKAMTALLGKPAQTKDRPNILFILADDLGYGDVGCYNPESKVPTPNLDKLATEGMRFTDAHSPSTVCTPTRYSLLTGQMAFRIGKGGVFTGVGGPCLIEEQRLTLPQMLREKGYTTASFGKWHVGMTFFDKDGNAINKNGLDAVKRVDYSRSILGSPIHRGFDEFFGTACCPTTDWLYAYIDGDRVPVPPTHIVDRGPLPDHPYSKDNRPGMIAPDFDLEEVDLVFLEKSRNFLEQHVKSSPDKPFFLFHSMQAVHLPSFPADRFKGKTDAGPHGDFIFEMDYIVGELMKTLDRLGIADNTLVMFSSDNGPEVPTVIAMRRDHQHDGARPWRGMKRDQWEGGHRVPFIARWPGRIAAGSTTDQTICLTDVMATCAAAVGAKLPNDAAEDSFNVLPVLLAEQGDEPVRKYTLHQTMRLALAIRRGPWKYLDHKGSGGNRYEGNRYLEKYIIEDAAPDAPGQLYNLETDPGETNNLYFKYPETVKELKSQLDRSKESGRSAPRRD